VVSLAGKTAVITGAARGIGEAIASRFAGEGANLILIDRDAEKLTETVAAVIAQGVKATAIVADLMDTKAIPGLASQICATYGGVDIVVSNAGIAGPFEPLEKHSFEGWQEVQTINLEAPLILLQHLASALFTAPEAAIVFISSIRGLNGVPVGAPYAASKAALNSITKSLACEWGQHGVRVNAVLPGPVETAIIQASIGDDLGMRQKLSDMSPLKRWAEPDDIAGPVAFLAGSDAKHVTGHLLVVDGGLTIQSPEHYAL
jgi:NAD(P)-dependent dehydrogenase (short-subunit alcohol dehydrogenase family)